MEEIVKKCFTNKLASNDTYNHYALTPDENDEGWRSAIVEARGYGIPIASFGDTRDKLVLHPGHLGYNFDYYWGNGSWSDSTCWNEFTEEIGDAYDDLQEIGNFLEGTEKFTVSYCNVSGSCKGYLSTDFLWGCRENEVSDIVLFVYGLTTEYMKKFIENH